MFIMSEGAIDPPDEDTLLTKTQHESIRRKEVMQRLTMTPVKCLFLGCESYVNLMEHKNSTVAFKEVCNAKSVDSVEANKESIVVCDDILSPLQSGNCVWWQNFACSSTITSETSNKSPKSRPIGRDVTTNCSTMESGTAADTEKSEEQCDTGVSSISSSKSIKKIRSASRSASSSSAASSLTALSAAASTSAASSVAASTSAASSVAALPSSALPLAVSSSAALSSAASSQAVSSSAASTSDATNDMLSYSPNDIRDADNTKRLFHPDDNDSFEANLSSIADSIIENKSPVAGSSSSNLEPAQKINIRTSPVTYKNDKNICDEKENKSNKSISETSLMMNPLLTPTSEGRVDVFVRLNRSEEAERLACKYFSESHGTDISDGSSSKHAVTLSTISDITEDTTNADCSDAMVINLDEFKDVEEVEPLPPKRQRRPLRRDSVQLYRATIKEHRKIRKSDKVIEEKEVLIVKICNDEQSQNYMNSASDESDPLSDNLSDLNETESSKLKLPGVPLVVVKKLDFEGLNSSDVNENVISTLLQHGNENSSKGTETCDSDIENKMDDSNRPEEGGVDRCRTKRKASIVARASISLIEAANTAESLSTSTTHKSDAKRRRKQEINPNVEDIYLNRLWREQMPKERNWYAILEDPVVATNTTKEKKQPFVQRRGRGRPIKDSSEKSATDVENDVEKENKESDENCVVNEDKIFNSQTAAVVNAVNEQDSGGAGDSNILTDGMRYFSLRARRCSLNFDQEPTKAKLNYRRKRAVQHGWKPVSKKRAMECEQRLMEVLEKMDEDIKNSA